MGKKNSKLKPETVETLMTMTYCEYEAEGAGNRWELVTARAMSAPPVVRGH